MQTTNSGLCYRVAILNYLKYSLFIKNYKTWKETQNVTHSQGRMQAIGTSFENPHMLNLVDSKFKSVILNMFK
jgi:hypothetical protein